MDGETLLRIMRAIIGSGQRCGLMAALTVGVVLMSVGCQTSGVVVSWQQQIVSSQQSADSTQRATPIGKGEQTANIESADDANIEEETRSYEAAGYLTDGEVVAETAVTTVPMTGDISQRSAELSGLAWYGDWLILLPQYPDFAGGAGDGRLFALARADIVAYLDGEKAGPLQPVEVEVVAPGIWRTIPGYEGFEAIAFDGDRAYLAVEASPRSGMLGYLLAGEMAADLSQLVVDMENLVPLPSASGLGNKSEESLLLAKEKVLTIHEANGVRVNDAPVAMQFDADLQPLGTLPFPAVEYRITDVTEVDEDGHFWAINYFFPGEFALRPEVDPIAESYGQGPTHAERDGVARLLEFQLSETGITLVDQPPIQLELLPFELRNWEGIVRLDNRGFLLVTDKFPETILGFVPHR